MSVKTRTTLAGYFLNGSVPTQDDFTDLIDSFVALTEDGIGTVEQQFGIATRIPTAYLDVRVPYTKALGEVTATVNSATVTATQTVFDAITQQNSLPVQIDGKLYTVVSSTDTPFTITFNTQLPRAGVVKVVGLGTDNLLNIKTASGTTALVVDTNGSVGMGTSTPSSTLDVSGHITARGFSGSGAYLTSIQASAISGALLHSTIAAPDITGTLRNAQLPASIPAANIHGALSASTIAAANITGTLLKTQLPASIPAANIQGALSNSTIAATDITGNLLPTQLPASIPAANIQGALSASTIAATAINGTLLQNQLPASIPAANIQEALSASTIAATAIKGTLLQNQLPASIPAANIQGALSNSTIAATDITGNLLPTQLPASIPAANIQGALSDSTIAAANITGTLLKTQLPASIPAANIQGVLSNSTIPAANITGALPSSVNVLFYADPVNTEAGSPVTFNWVAGTASSLTLGYFADDTVHTQQLTPAAAGSTQITVSQDTVFTLTAKNDNTVIFQQQLQISCVSLSVVLNAYISKLQDSKLQITAELAATSCLTQFTALKTLSVDNITLLTKALKHGFEHSTNLPHVIAVAYAPQTLSIAESEAINMVLFKKQYLT